MASARINPGKERRTAEDRATFERALCAVEPMSRAALEAGWAEVRLRRLARGEHLLRVGERAHQVALLLEGLVREHFVLPDGREGTKAFITAGDMTGSIADLLSGEPSRVAIVADEPSRLLVVSFAALRALGSGFPEWERYGRTMMERVLLAKALREYELLGLDAEARYRAFSARFPGLEARVAARHVASYLGITPVHLSRLRRRRREARGER